MDESKAGNEDLYRAAVGESKAHYYLPRFERFDTPGASLISWNWPSLFVPFFWMLYRRMYGLALAYFILWPISLAILFSVLMVIIGEQSGTIAYWIVVLGVRFVAIPVYANALYHRSVKRRIEKLSADAPSQEAVVQRLIGQRSNVGVVVGVTCFAFVAIIGVLAAIAIPAYQDYTIRAQVVEGLNLAARVKASVADAYVDSESWPVDLAAIGLDAKEFRGAYVESIDVSNGAVLIRYGNAAHSSITGHTLTLHPVNLSDGDVQWSCGYAGLADGDALAPQTDVAPKYLPSLCRPQVR